VYLVNLLTGQEHKILSVQDNTSKIFVNHVIIDKHSKAHVLYKIEFSKRFRLFFRVYDLDEKLNARHKR